MNIVRSPLLTRDRNRCRLLRTTSRGMKFITNDYACQNLQCTTSSHMLTSYFYTLTRNNVRQATYLLQFSAPRWRPTATDVNMFVPMASIHHSVYAYRTVSHLSRGLARDSSSYMKRSPLWRRYVVENESSMALFCCCCCCRCYFTILSTADTHTLPSYKFQSPPPLLSQVVWTICAVKS